MASENQRLTKAGAGTSFLGIAALVLLDRLAQVIDLLDGWEPLDPM